MKKTEPKEDSTKWLKSMIQS